MEDSHIPLHKWLLAFHLMCSSKNGVSALQIQRELWGKTCNKESQGQLAYGVVHVPSHPVGHEADAIHRNAR
jgi:hypothetical protein